MHILERYFDDPDSITKEEMLTVIRRATIDGVIIPMMCGSAFKNKGVQRLLDSVCAFLPSPLDKGKVTGINPVILIKKLHRTADVDEPLAALGI